MLQLELIVSVGAEVDQKSQSPCDCDVTTRDDIMVDTLENSLDSLGDSLVIWTREDLLLPGLYMEQEDQGPCQPCLSSTLQTCQDFSFFLHKFISSVKILPVFRSFQVG